ncbi:hypothetical protein [Paraburkholderia bryophila]|uniref:Uncharacterized protein n=1 Tax=Paraburkholderia bryophila TaxID=420952 RepID=A0A329B7T3_9BURK|nr:hypothetical protein [Paraburkholderia bryophila]RAS16057.1 hypothetical protein BX591_15114 [Paraburkholderia bryophila]
MTDEIERLAQLALRAIRPRFEIWAGDNGYSVERSDKGDPGSKYASLATQAAFEGWCGALFDSVDNTGV